MRLFENINFLKKKPAPLPETVFDDYEEMTPRQEAIMKEREETYAQAEDIANKINRHAQEEGTQVTPENAETREGVLHALALRENARRNGRLH